MGRRPKEMPCPVCKETVPVKRTHRGKPYWQCDACGVQVFVRRQEGMKRLEEADEEKTNKREALPFFLNRHP